MFSKDVLVWFTVFKSLNLAACKGDEVFMATSLQAP